VGVRVVMQVRDAGLVAVYICVFSGGAHQSCVCERARARARAHVFAHVCACVSMHVLVRAPFCVQLCVSMCEYMLHMHAHVSEELNIPACHLTEGPKKSLFHKGIVPSFFATRLQSAIRICFDNAAHRTVASRG
jgi:hypothetical protein